MTTFSKVSVLVSTSSFGAGDPAPLRMLEEAGVAFALNDLRRKLTEDEIRERVGSIDGLIAGTEPLTAGVLQAAPRLKVISRAGTGMDNVDVAAAERLGIAVFRTPDALVDAVAELTVGGLIALMRRVHTMDADVRAGRWSKQVGRLLTGKTIGIVGLGRIGKRVVDLLQGWRVRVLACDLNPDREWAAAHDVQIVDRDRLLAEADVVTLHSSGEGSASVMEAADLAKMKPGAFLVNTARGRFVREDALHAALGSGALAGAFLDTFEAEPYRGPLTELPNVLLTPHIGSYAAEARLRMEIEAVENLLAGLAAAGLSDKPPRLRRL